MIRVIFQNIFFLKIYQNNKQVIISPNLFTNHLQFQINTTAGL